MSHCPYCTQTSASTFCHTTDIFGDEFDLLVCSNCDAHYLDPMPTGAQLARAYDDSYYGEGEEKFEGPVEKALNVFRDLRASHLAKLLNRTGKVLDIGCGNGNFLAAVGKRGQFELHGSELEGGSAERAKRVQGIQLHLGELQELEFESDSFDGITLFHVFEHVTNPKEVLEIIARILKPGGHLVMSFPNIGSFQSRFFRGMWLHLDPPRHIFFFRPKAFKKIMKDHGFEVLREKHFQPEYNPFGFQQSILNRLVGQREVLYEHLKRNTEYTKDYSKSSLLIQKLFFMASFPFFIAVDMLEGLLKSGGTVEFTLRKKQSPL